MSSTGVWVVGAIPDEAARSLPERFVHLMSQRGPTRPSGYSDHLAWWSGGGDREPFFAQDPELGTLVPTPAALRLNEFVSSANPDTDVLTAMRDAAEELMSEGGDIGRFAAVAHRAGPAAALCHALGAAAFALLPGWFGDFLLSNAEVRAALPGAEQALNIRGVQRAEALTRITTWMTVMGDDHAFDAAELLDAPLRVLRYAAETGLGAAAHSRWY